jgi:hypothetical protein
MPRGARLAATLLLFCSGGCVDLSPPPELEQPRLRDAGVEDAPAPDGPDNPPPQPTGTDPDAAPDTPAPDASAPDAAAPDVVDAGMDLAADVTDTSADAADGGFGRSPDAAVLTIDDFGDDTISPNTLGAPVRGDNQAMQVATGELSFRWNSSGVFQAFSEQISPDSCARDIRGYRTFRFRMRASAGGKEVKLNLGQTDATCTGRSFVSLGSISPTTTMSSYSVDLQTVPRDRAASFEWQPPASDTTTYTIDDIQLLP